MTRKHFLPSSQKFQKLEPRPVFNLNHGSRNNLARSQSEEPDAIRVRLKSRQKNDQTVNKRPRPSMPKMPWEDK
jgi:hypothetical protein